MRINTKILLGIAIIVATVSANAETGLRRDSLVHAIKILEKQPASIARDTLLMFYYNDLCEKSIFGGDTLADARLEQFRVAQSKSKWPIAEALYLRALGKKYDKKGDYQQAIEYYHQALRIMEKNKASPEHIVYTKILLGFVMLNSGNKPECLKLFKEAEPAALQLKNSSHAIWILDFYADDALYEAESKEDYLKALRFYKRAEALLPNSLIENQIPNNLQGQAKVYHLLGEERFSEEYRAKALEHAKRIPNYFVLYNIYTDYATNALAKENYNLAILYQEDAINAAKSMGYLEFLNRGYYDLYQVYKTAGLNSKALETLELYNVLEDSLKRKEVNERYAELESQYAFEQQQNRIADLENKQLQYLIWALASALLIGILISLYLNSNSRKLRTLNELLSKRNKDVEEALNTGKMLEQQHMSRELHDSVATKITALKWKIEANEAEIESIVYNSVVKDLEKLYEEVRFIAHNLRPLEFLDLGLKKAIENLFINLNKQSKTHFECKVSDKVNTIDKALQYHIFQMVLELCTNTKKHANATEVKLLLTVKKELLLVFNDNGSNVESDTAKAGIGLKSMETKVEKYGGKMSFDRHEGFKVSISIPLAN